MLKESEKLARIAALTSLGLFVCYPSFASDIPAVFYISNNDTDSKVAYGIRLNSNCSPVGNNPIYYYWLRTNNSTRNLNNLEEGAYGISRQSVSGNNITFRVNAFQRYNIQKPVKITTSRSSNGGCQAAAFTTFNTNNGVTTKKLSSAHIEGRSRKFMGKTVQFTVKNVIITAGDQSSETISCSSNCTVGIPIP
jgi:Domain of unknown function (DUF4833)